MIAEFLTVSVIHFVGVTTVKFTPSNIAFFLSYCFLLLSKNQLYGFLKAQCGNTTFSHIPDWYEWQRKCVHEEIDSGCYRLDTEVEVQALPNAVNFIDCGTGHLVHDSNGFSLTFTDYGDDHEKTLKFPPLSMISVHTEYDYRKKGQCITLSTLDNTYFLFPEKSGFNATKIQFATEYLYKKALKQSEKST